MTNLLTLGEVNFLFQAPNRMSRRYQPPIHPLYPMKKSIFVFSSLFIAAIAQAEVATKPEVFSISARELATARDRLAHGDTALAPALAALRAEADRALRLKPLSVMDKLRTPPSGDKHDYISLAPYWWPDPQNPKGPYVRHDGLRNPATGNEKNSDRSAWSKVGSAIETLGLAYYFTGNEAYAEHATQLTRVWFIDPATRMNPNINFGQYVTGVNEGREEGVLEFRSLIPVCDSLALIAASPAWTEKDTKAFHAWLTAYFTWLTESPIALAEAAALNNHGTWYDAQAADIALVLGQTDYAKKILVEGLKKRLARQVEPDGRQPLELARTRSLNYCLFNLEALFNMARLGDHVGVDWWSYTTPDGRNIRVALRYLAPYGDPDKPWPKDDIVAGSRAQIFALFAQALRHGDEPLYSKMLHFSSADARWHLLWP